MSNIKALAFDIDGTLLPIGDHKLSKRLIKELNKLKSSYLLICVTGRHILELEDINDVKFDAYVTSNGQMTTMKDGKNVSNFMNKEDTMKIVDYVIKHNIACAITEDKRYYINFINQKVKEYHYTSIFPLPEIKQFEDINFDKIINMTIFDNESVIDDILDITTKTMSVRNSRYASDLYSSDAGKMNGLSKALEILNINKEEVMAFGDGDNDAEMIKECGIGVAMGNAVKVVKENADYITSNVRRSGIINALKYYGIEGEK